jgi:hypothetical protein
MRTARKSHQRLSQAIFAHAAVRHPAKSSRARAKSTRDQRFAEFSVAAFEHLFKTARRKRREARRSASPTLLQQRGRDPGELILLSPHAQKITLRAKIDSRSTACVHGNNKIIVVFQSFTEIPGGAINDRPGKM